MLEEYTADEMMTIAAARKLHNFGIVESFIANAGDDVEIDFLLRLSPSCIRA